MKLSEMRDSKAPSRKVSKSCEAYEALQIVLMIAGDQVTVSVLEPAHTTTFCQRGRFLGLRLT